MQALPDPLTLLLTRRFLGGDMIKVKGVNLTQRDIEETPILAALEKLENYVDVSCWRMIQIAKQAHKCGHSAADIQMKMEFVRIK